MDILIVSTRTPQQEKYWQKRLEQLRGVIIQKDAYVVVIHEDWPGGAGNGLGTLYAYKKAEEKAKQKDKVDIRTLQQKGRSVAIFHTVGKGQRLWPLAAGEYGNKSAVKLPMLLPDSEQDRSLSILEAIIVQSSLFAPYRKGRLSVFWGDQIFLPSKPLSLQQESPIDIYAKLGTLKSQEEWEARDLSKYGFIAVNRQGAAQHIDKSDFTTIAQLIENGIISIDGGAGLSLGSFSLSSQMTFALLDEFSKELDEKIGFMDTDPHLWMPMTLDEETYTSLMAKKGHPQSFAKQHYRRMQSFKNKFTERYSYKQFFSVVDVGEECLWWDYGSVGSYFENVMKLTGDCDESDAMRKFFRLTNTKSVSKRKGLEVDSRSILIDCNIQEGKIENSVLMGVNAESAMVSDSVVINCACNTMHADRCLLYNVIEEGHPEFSAKMVRADLILPETKEHVTLYSELGRNGKDDWKVLLPKNRYTYEQLQKILENVDILQAEAIAWTAREHAIEFGTM